MRSLEGSTRTAGSKMKQAGLRRGAGAQFLEPADLASNGLAWERGTLLAFFPHRRGAH